MKKTTPTKKERYHAPGEIYEKYGNKLLGFINSRVGATEGEDILQDVFYKLSEMDQIANPIEHISGWLYRVSKNLILDRVKKKKEVRSEDIPQQMSRAEYGGINSSTGTENLAVSNTIMDALDDALQELPQSQRAVFIMTEIEGFSFREISEMTGEPLNTLISRKHYAVKHLRDRLGFLYNELTQ